MSSANDIIKENVIVIKNGIAENDFMRFFNSADFTNYYEKEEFS